MSILIKGMEMPKDGTYNIVHIYSDGHVSMPFLGKGMQIVSGITAAPVVHGKWVKTDDDPEDTAYQCSVCGKEALYKYNTCDSVCSEYCPQCGAKMDLLN